MSWRTTIRYFVIPALALVITFKIYIWLNHVAADYFGKPAEVKSSGEALIGGSFSLVNQDEKIVTDKDFKGKYMLVYFGFTNCPHICPTDMALITNVMQQMGDKAKEIQPIFVTIDPENDNAAQLKKFLANFYPEIIGLTGTKEQIASIVNKYHIYAKQVETDKVGEYLMDHSAYIYLMGPDGKYITHFSDKQAEDKIVADIVSRF